MPVANEFIIIIVCTFYRQIQLHGKNRDCIEIYAVQSINQMEEEKEKTPDYEPFCICALYMSLNVAYCTVIQLICTRLLACHCQNIYGQTKIGTGSNYNTCTKQRESKSICDSRTLWAMLPNEFERRRWKKSWFVDEDRSVCECHASKLG